MLIIHPYFNCIEYEIWIYIIQQYIFIIAKKFFGFHRHWSRSNTKLFDYIHPKTGHNPYDCSRGVLIKKYWIVRPEIDNIAQANRVPAILSISSLEIQYSLSCIAQTIALRIFGCLYITLGPMTDHEIDQIIGP